MSLVRVKRKHQVTIPVSVCDELALDEGDFLDVQVEGNRIVLTPQVVLDRATIAAIDEGLDEYEAGETIGPFESVEDFKEYVKSNP
jgi:AbrB family looped-hinge helix DNA binding protein